MWILGLKGLTSPTEDGTTILCDHPSQVVDRILVVVVFFFMMILSVTSLELLTWASSNIFVSPCFKLSFFELP